MYQLCYLFVIYSGINFSHFCLSHVTLGYSEAGTRPWFQVFLSDVDSSGSWNSTVDQQKHAAYMQFIFQLGWMRVGTDLTSLINDEIILSKIGDLFNPFVTT